jgi:hypothetical protein
MDNDDLVVLRLDLTSNAGDSEILANLKATQERGFIPFDIEPHKDKPLIFCGSGPSLDKYFPAVRRMYPDSPVMAVNGAYAHLIEKYGEAPAYYAQLDARDCNENFLRVKADNTVFLLASQVHPNIFALCPPERTRVFHIHAPSAHEIFPKEKIYVGSGGGTIGTTAIALAAMLGYRHQCLLGLDSSFANGKTHACDQAQNGSGSTLPVYVEDREYTTTPAMAKQVEQFRWWVIRLTEKIPDLDLRLFGEGLLYDYILTGQNRPAATRESEAHKYALMYDDPNYGMSEDRKKAVAAILESVSRDSLLDVGTGRGETIQMARAAGVRLVRGTETVHDLCDRDVVFALLPNLPHLTNSYDTVTSFEVLEHLLPQDVIPALQELARVARLDVIVSVCTVPDIRGGADLHPSARSQEAWLEAMRVAWGDDADISLIGQASPLGVSPIFRYRVKK